MRVPIDSPVPLFDELVRTKRKTLGITVMPDKRVIVRAPLDATIDQVAAKLLLRERWIRRQQAFFERFNPRTHERRYVSGEGHLYLGRRYRLKIVRGEKTGVKLAGGYLTIEVSLQADADAVKKQLLRWYRCQAQRHFKELAEKAVQQHFPTIGPVPVQIRKLTPRWGSCSAEGSLTLNLDLIRAPKACIEYVILHELCHLREPNHSKRFYSLLESVLPDWRKRKDLLERLLA